jgi:hypothetical protein
MLFHWTCFLTLKMEGLYTRQNGLGPVIARDHCGNRIHGESEDVSGFRVMRPVPRLFDVRFAPSQCLSYFSVIYFLQCDEMRPANSQGNPFL